MEITNKKKLMFAYIGQIPAEIGPKIRNNFGSEFDHFNILKLI